MKSITKFLKNNHRLLIIIVLGFALRLIGLNWDQSFHLHPDERFLSMVAADLSLPKSLNIYFDSALSPLNPQNTHYPFFVYGTFPLIFTKLIGLSLKLDSYDQLFLVGRFLSSLLDTSVILAIYLIAKLLAERIKIQSTVKANWPIYSALFYAVFVFPIQQAHFWTTDSFLNTFFIWSFYFALQYYLSQNKTRFIYFFLSALLLNFALASKISILYIIPLVLLPIFGKKFSFLVLAGYLLAIYFLLRLFYPYLFQYPNFFNITLNLQFINSIKQLVAYSGKSIPYPPAYQWYDKNFFFGLYNIVFFGIGVVNSGLFMLGVYSLFRNLKFRVANFKLIKNFKFKVSNSFAQYRDRFLLLALGSYLIFFFVYQSLQFAKSMRYYIFLYPFLALGCGYSLLCLKHRFWKRSWFLLGFLWTLAFVHIYLAPHSRVTASIWMHQALPAKSTIAYEYWDDPLPLATVNATKSFNFVALEIYNQPDSQEKWRLLTSKMQYVDYLSLSSNRLYGTIPNLPQVFPYASRYYSLLIAGKLGFKKVAEFTSYPSLGIGNWKLEIPDQLAEEAFTVYDHPRVLIFQKTKDFDKEHFFSKITQ